MRQSNAASVQAIYAAINAGDESTLKQRLAEDFLFEQRTDSPQLPWLLICRGRSETIAALQPTPAGWLRLTVMTLFDGGDRVTAQVEISWQPQRPSGRDTQPITWREGHQWLFDAHGLATRLRQESELPRPNGRPAKILPFVPFSPR